MKEGAECGDVFCRSTHLGLVRSLDLLRRRRPGVHPEHVVVRSRRAVVAAHVARPRAAARAHSPSPAALRSPTFSRRRMRKSRPHLARYTMHARNWVEKPRGEKNSSSPRTRIGKHPARLLKRKLVFYQAPGSSSQQGFVPEINTRRLSSPSLHASTPRSIPGVVARRKSGDDTTIYRASRALRVPPLREDALVAVMGCSTSAGPRVDRHAPPEPAASFSRRPGLALPSPLSHHVKPMRGLARVCGPRKGTRSVVRLDPFNPDAATAFAFAFAFVRPFIPGE